MSAPAPTVWPSLAYDDAHAAIRFLVDAFGFVELFVTGDADVVHHAELTWPLGGGVMLGSRRDSDAAHMSRNEQGPSSAYVITDEPDAVHARATAAGARIVRELVDEDYGSRGFTAADPEGNLWSFGTYRGADPDAA